MVDLKDGEFKNRDQTPEEEPLSSKEDKKEHFTNSQEKKSMEELYHYATDNKEPIMAYIILAIGVLFLFIFNFLGELIIGGVAGYYYADDIIYFIRHFNHFYRQQGQVRYVIMIIVLLALFIGAPGIFIGAAVATGIREIARGKKMNR